VLKDEDLRKKYDTHGEEGLSENFGQGRYQSWKFYQEEFGTNFVLLKKAIFSEKILTFHILVYLKSLS